MEESETGQNLNVSSSNAHTHSQRHHKQHQNRNFQQNRFKYDDKSNPQVFHNYPESTNSKYGRNYPNNSTTSTKSYKNLSKSQKEAKYNDKKHNIESNRVKENYSRYTNNGVNTENVYNSDYPQNHATESLSSNSYRKNNFQNRRFKDEINYKQQNIGDNSTDYRNSDKYSDENCFNNNVADSSQQNSRYKSNKHKIDRKDSKGMSNSLNSDISQSTQIVSCSDKTVDSNSRHHKYHNMKYNSTRSNSKDLPPRFKRVQNTNNNNVEETNEACFQDVNKFSNHVIYSKDMSTSSKHHYVYRNNFDKSTENTDSYIQSHNRDITDSDLHLPGTSRSNRNNIQYCTSRSDWKHCKSGYSYLTPGNSTVNTTNSDNIYKTQNNDYHTRYQDKKSHNTSSIKDLPPRLQRIQISNNKDAILDGDNYSSRDNYSYQNATHLKGFSSRSTNHALNRIIPGNNLGYTNNNNHDYKRPNLNLNKRTTLNNSNGDQSQREIMDELLRKGKYECIVCCDMVKVGHKTWNCQNCYNVFHLKCIQMWARSSTSDAKANDQNTNEDRRNRNKNNQNDEWRCPTCQNVEKKFPFAYFCFCGKMKEPELSNYHVPHSCGETCSRHLKLFHAKPDADSEDYFECVHKCVLMCHPGKCPPCTTKVERTCACSKTKVILNCVSKIDEIKCDKLCDKLLNCQNHRCPKNCHFGDCDPCEEVFEVRCFCGKESKPNIACGNKEKQYSCGGKCSKMLSCGFHTCSEPCHNGECGSCPFSPETVKYCSCGNTPISKIENYKPRLLCVDPIPVCDKVCNKRLPCGSATDPHLCTVVCHLGSCPPCGKSTIIRCECGANSQKIECKNLNSNNFKCKRRCNKKFACGRHKCLNECCTISEHICTQICGRKLECGKHTCSEPCHFSCKPCPNIIWSEVYCNCGDKVLYPPLPCNTAKPTCDKPCARVHPCEHQPSHQCHDDLQCPPCIEFVSRMCYGGHKECQSVPCFQTGVSCGTFCMKPLACNLHHCTKVCHNNDCPPCAQRCNKHRQACEHLCGLPCHQNNSQHCPESPCKEIVKVFCKCELKSEELPCYQVNDANKFQAALDSMIRRYGFNTSIDFDEMKQMVQYNILHPIECDGKCIREKRNQDLAKALDIDISKANDISSVKYSDQLKNETRKNPQFILTIHDKIVQLINNFKKANSKILSYHFQPMNRAKRELVHLYASHFGCQTESLDQEPNRSVIVTANKSSFIPSPTIFEAINMDINQLRPKPNVVKYKCASEESKNKKVIDYFEF